LTPKARIIDRVHTHSDDRINMMNLLAFSMPGLPEWIMIGAVGLLIFGKRLPDVGRSLGQGIVEFKRGLKGIKDDVEEESNKPAGPKPLPGAKFDPYTGKPMDAGS